MLNLKSGLIKLNDIIGNMLIWKRISPIYELSELGVLRKKQSFGYYYSYGTKTSHGYFKIMYKEKIDLIHVLVAKLFLNNGEDISQKLTIELILILQITRKIIYE